jgi:hypothetical protein
MSSDRIPIGKVIPGRPVGLPEPEGVPSVKRGDRQSESPVGLKNGTRNPPPASFTAQNSIETKAPHSKGNHKSMPRASSPRNGGTDLAGRQSHLLQPRRRGPFHHYEGPPAHLVCARKPGTRSQQFRLPPLRQDHRQEPGRCVKGSISYGAW